MSLHVVRFLTDSLKISMKVGNECNIADLLNKFSITFCITLVQAYI